MRLPRSFVILGLSAACIYLRDIFLWTSSIILETQDPLAYQEPLTHHESFRFRAEHFNLLEKQFDSRSNPNNGMLNISSESSWDFSPITHRANFRFQPEHWNILQNMWTRQDATMTTGISPSLRASDNNDDNYHDSPPQERTAPFEFSACLLVKDDGALLPEWLAYHYTVLPLQHLIVAVDPFSLTSPRYILNKYRNLGMHITIWQDKDYMFNGTRSTDHAIYGKPKYRRYLVRAHRWRQRVFMSKCLHAHQKAGRSWVILPDTDEYLTYNNYRPDEGEPWACRVMGDEPDAAEARQACNEEFLSQLRNGENPRDRLPEIGAPYSTMADFIHSKMNLTLNAISPWEYLLRKCSVIPRLTIGGKTCKRNVSIPDGFDTTEFRTYHYRLHEEKENNWYGKSLVDVSRFSDMSRRLVHNVHRVFTRDCNCGMTVNHSEAIFRLNHYSGSMEEYLSRPGDVRRTAADYESKNDYVVAGETLEMMGWLPAFIALVGHDRAHRLTSGLRKWALQNNLEANRFYAGRNSKKLATLSLLRAGILQPSDISGGMGKLFPRKKARRERQ